MVPACNSALQRQRQGDWKFKLGLPDGSVGKRTLLPGLKPWDPFPGPTGRTSLLPSTVHKEVQGHPHPHSKFKAGMAYLRLSQKTNRQPPPTHCALRYCRQQRATSRVFSTSPPHSALPPFSDAPGEETAQGFPPESPKLWRLPRTPVPSTVSRLLSHPVFSDCLDQPGAGLLFYLLSLPKCKAGRSRGGSQHRLAGLSTCEEKGGLLTSPGGHTSRRRLSASS